MEYGDWQTELGVSEIGLDVEGMTGHGPSSHDDSGGGAGR